MGLTAIAQLASGEALASARTCPGSSVTGLGPVRKGYGKTPTPPAAAPPPPVTFVLSTLSFPLSFHTCGHDLCVSKI